MEPHQRVGENVRALRLAAGLSQEALAARADLHRTEISLLERAGREPRLSTIVKVARALKVKPADLLAGVK